MSIPIYINTSEINTFIIGDFLSKDNCLIKKRETGKTLYWYVSTENYTKANTSNIGLLVGSAIATIENEDFTSHALSVPAGVYAYNNYCIADAYGNLYLAVNQIGLDGNKTVISTIHFNALEEKE